MAEADELACEKCNSRESLVVIGLTLDADYSWAVQCWGDDCGRPTYYINDTTRDELFGTGWRTPPVADPRRGRRSREQTGV